jgi:hypothetical protein
MEALKISKEELMGARKLMCMYLENNEMSAADMRSEVETGTVLTKRS